MLSARMCALQARHACTAFKALKAPSAAQLHSVRSLTLARPTFAVTGAPRTFTPSRSFASAPPTLDKKQDSASNATAATPEKPAKMGIKAMFKEYGVPFLVWECVMWLGTGVVVYGAVTVAGGYDHVLPYLKSLGVDKYVDTETLDPRYGNLAIAVAINEALEVFRFPVVVATTPFIAKWWRARRAIKK